MVRARLACAFAAVLVIANGVAADICSDATTCIRQGGARSCDRRTNTNCPPCLRLGTANYECFDLFQGACPPATTLCSASAAPSGSGSGVETPTPTTLAPSAGSSDSGSSSSESGSGSATPEPTKKTRKPTTVKPITTAPATKAPTTPSPTKNVTEAPVATTTAPIDTNASNESGSSLPLIAGIVGAVVVVVAVIAFLIWKRNTDDDDDSDDDDYRFNKPPATFNTRGPVPTYNNSNMSRAVTSPVGRVGNYGAGAQRGVARYGGAAAGAGAASQYGPPRNAGATDYSSGGMYGAQYGANTNYGSPTNVDGDSREMYTGAGGVVYENRDSLADSRSSAEDSRDAWGNTVAKNNDGKAPRRPVPTSKTVSAAQRDNRTLSNVSIEF